MKIQGNLTFYRYAWIGLFLIVMVQGCSTNRLKPLIDNEIQRCDSDSCVVDLRITLGIDWDYLYVFNEYDSPSLISEIIGITYSGRMVPDQHSRIILVKGTKVAAEDDYCWQDSPAIQFQKKDWKNDRRVVFSRADTNWYILRDYQTVSRHIFFKIKAF